MAQACFSSAQVSVHPALVQEVHYRHPHHCWFSNTHVPPERPRYHYQLGPSTLIKSLEKIKIGHLILRLGYCGMKKCLAI